MGRAKSGVENGNWKGDLAGEDAGRARARASYELGPCQQCGKPAVDRHHKDGDTLNNTPGNVEPLCRRCHMTADGRIKLLPTFGVPRKPAAVSICRICGDEFRPLRRGRCRKCSLYFYAFGAERPLARLPITHCPRGHEYTPENTRIDKKGCKNCRACRAEDARAYRAMAKAIIAGTTEDPRGNI